MVAGCWVLLFVARLMLFVYYYESKSLERQHYCRTGTENHFVRRVGKLFLPYLHAFRIGVFRVVDAQPAAEHLFQPRHYLHRKGYLGQQVKHLSSMVYFLLYEVDVYFRFSARCHAMQQYDVLHCHLSQYLAVCRSLCLA